MCRIIDKLILCSCDKDLDFYENHWVLKRVNSAKGVIIGETMLPYDLDPEVEAFNVETILSLINGGNCFDFEMVFEEKDVLVLFFKGNGRFQVDKRYAFEYQVDQWRSIEIDNSILDWYECTVRKGFILRA